MDKTKKTIEAALFISGRWMSAEDLARVTGSGSVGAVKEATKSLKREYDEREGGVKMSEVNGKYRLEITPDVREKVYYLAPEPELSPALIKTLALIAYKQPIYQSKVVGVIGNRAYEYIKELRKKEFIQVRKKGRTKQLSTTGKFRKYFALEEGTAFKPELEEELQKKLDEAVDEDGDQKKLDVAAEEELDEAGEAIDELKQEEATVSEENEVLVEGTEDIPNDAPREETQENPL